VTRTFGHLPFGDSWYESGTPDKWKFTTYERDSETNLDYAMYRYRSSVQGRFMSPDPAGALAADMTDPQTWNRYSYVSNSPVDSVDPDGLCTDVYGGIDTPNKNNGRGSAYFLNALGAVKGFDVHLDYGPGKPAGVGNVLLQDIGGVNSVSHDFGNDIAASDGDPNGIQLMGFSGGAQVISTGYDDLSPNLQGQITQITYFSPGVGLFTSLTAFPHGTVSTQSFHGHGVKDVMATFFSRMFGHGGKSLPCGHDIQCLYLTAPLSVTRGFTKCPGSPQHPIFGGGGDRGFNLAKSLFDGWAFGTGVIGFREGSDVWGSGIWWSPSWQWQIDGFIWPFPRHPDPLLAPQ